MLLLLTKLLLLTALAGADVDFEGLTCRTDFPKTLPGRLMSDHAPARLEQDYRKLGLKHLGRVDGEFDVNVASWRLCGQTYLISKKLHKVGAVVKISGKSAPIWGHCTPNFAAAGSPAILLSSEANERRIVHAWGVSFDSAKLNLVNLKDYTCKPGPGP